MWLYEMFKTNTRTDTHAPANYGSASINKVKTTATPAGPASPDDSILDNIREMTWVMVHEI